MSKNITCDNCGADFKNGDYLFVLRDVDITRYFDSIECANQFIKKIQNRQLNLAKKNHDIVWCDVLNRCIDTSDESLIKYKEEKSSSSYLKDYMEVLDSVHGYLMSKYSDTYFKLSSVNTKKLLLLRICV